METTNDKPKLHVQLFLQESYIGRDRTHQQQCYIQIQNEILKYNLNHLEFLFESYLVWL